jgi:hypothetical protein
VGGLAEGGRWVVMVHFSKIFSHSFHIFAPFVAKFGKKVKAGGAYVLSL